MTISSSQNSVVFQGNDATNVFDIPFVMDAASDIIVFYTNSSGIITVIPQTQYIISINPPATGMIWGIGGTLQYPISGSPIAAGTSINVTRLLPLQQNTSLTNQGNFYPQVVEAALDTLEMQIQQVSARTGQIRGIWQPNTSYNYGDMVQDGSYGLDSLNYYLCAQTNVSSSSWSNDLAVGYWSLALPATIPVTPLPLSIANGGTGASSAATALANLGCVSLAGNNVYTGTNNFTGGSAQVSTRSVGDSSAYAASTAFVNGTALTLATGTTAVTQANSDATTKVATDAFVQNVLTAKGAVLQNLLPNTQWQVATGMGSVTKMNSQGTGTQNVVAVTSFTTGSNTVVFNTANTQQAKVGDIGLFSAGDAAITLAPMRITAVSSNVSFTANLPWAGKASTSSAKNFQLITVGDYTGASGGAAFDGWTKNPSSLIIWRDDFSINQKAGSPYSVGFRKDSNSTEYYYSSLSPNDVEKLAGRTLVFGAWVYQKAQGGSGTWTLFVNDSGNQYTAPTNGTGSSVGGYQWLEFSFTVSSTCTYLEVGLQLNGTTNDIYYLSQPIMAFGTFLGVGNYIQNSNERLDFLVHLNAPTLTPYSGTFPSTVWTPGATYYGYELDLEAICFCQVTRTIKSITGKIEYTTATPGLVLQFVDYLGAPGIFGPEVSTQVANKVVCDIGDWYIDQGNKYAQGYFGITTFTTPSAVIANITVDFSSARLS